MYLKNECMNWGDHFNVDSDAVVFVLDWYPALWLWMPGSTAVVFLVFPTFLSNASTIKLVCSSNC